MKSQKKIFKDIFNFIKCDSGLLYKYEWTHVFMYASKMYANKKTKMFIRIFLVVESMSE